MNENRKEFGSLIELILNNKVERIFITYKDRFSRFGFDYFKKICDHFNTEIVILKNQINEENFQKAEAMIQLMCELNAGLRSADEEGWVSEEELEKQLKLRRHGRK